MLPQERLDLLKRLASGVASLFGPACEVVVHDLAQGDLEQTVVHIENGCVSGRELGDGPSHAVLGLLRKSDPCPQDHLAYLTQTATGKVLKSSSLYIRDHAGQPQAVFSINYDMSTFVSMQDGFGQLTVPQQETPTAQPILSSVAGLLDELLAQSVALVGRPVPLMEREHKRRAIRFLSDQGALRIAKAGDKIASFFDISKYTLYSYLDN